jgi:hypothetical protein
MHTSWLRLDSHKIPSSLKPKGVMLQLLHISHSPANQFSLFSGRLFRLLLPLCMLMGTLCPFHLAIFYTIKQDRDWNIFNVKNCSIGIPSFRYQPKRISDYLRGSQ